MPELAASQMWAGPQPEDGEEASRPDSEVAQLAHRLASRSMPVDEAEAAIDQFAEGLAPAERNRQLTRLFHDVLQLINQERSQIIAGIKRYTRKQQRLAEKIAQDSQKLADLQPGTTPDAQTQELLEARQWDLRVFEDRRRILTQICEQPVLLEQRAFSLSRDHAGPFGTRLRGSRRASSCAAPCGGDMKSLRKAVRRPAMLGLAAAALAAIALEAPRAAPADYPTETLADYVFGCMATNGQSQEALRRCSCSIDAIAAKLPYEQYLQAETVLRLQQAQGGERMVMFRTSPWAQAMVDKLRQAQVEAELRCF